MRLHNLHSPVGATKKPKRVGRGESSGHGKTAGRGGKGQTARTGKGKPRPGYEGGQVPMYRRMPKRGFTNIFALECAEVNVEKLGEFFPAGATVDIDALRALGLAKRTTEKVRILGRGELPHRLTVKADHFTAGAKEKILAAGGSVIELTKTE